MNAIFVLIASEEDRDNGLFIPRFKSFDKLEHCIVLSESATPKVETNIANTSFSSDVVALLIAPDFLSKHAGTIIGGLSKGWIKGVFMHPGRNNAPHRTHIATKLERYMSASQEEIRVTIARKAVAFSIGAPDPKSEYRVPEFNDLWNWLYSNTGVTCPCPSAATLSEIYRRLWHRETLTPLLSVALQLEGVAFEACSEGDRLKWAAALFETLQSDEWCWLEHEEGLADANSAFKSSAGARNITAIADAARALLNAIKTFAANAPASE